MWMFTGEEEGSAGDNFVELDVWVNRDELVDGELFEFRQQIPAHRQQEDRIAEGQGSSTAAGYGDADAHDVSKVGVLGHERVI